MFLRLLLFACASFLCACGMPEHARVGDGDEAFYGRVVEESDSWVRFDVGPEEREVASDKIGDVKAVRATLWAFHAGLACADAGVIERAKELLRRAAKDRDKELALEAKHELKKLRKASKKVYAKAAGEMAAAREARGEGAPGIVIKGTGETKNRRASRAVDDERVREIKESMERERGGGGEPDPEPEAADPPPSSSQAAPKETRRERAQRARKKKGRRTRGEQRKRNRERKKKRGSSGGLPDLREPGSNPPSGAPLDELSKLRIGDSGGAISAALGEPSSKSADGNFWVYERRGLALLLGSGRLKTLQADIDQPPSAGKASYPSVWGVRKGMSRDDVLRRLGTPNNASTRSASSPMTYRHGGYVVVFTFKKQKPYRVRRAVVRGR